MSLYSQQVITCIQVWTILQPLQKPLAYKFLLVWWVSLGQCFVARKDVVEAKAGVVFAAPELWDSHFYCEVPGLSGLWLPQ